MDEKDNENKDEKIPEPNEGLKKESAEERTEEKAGKNKTFTVNKNHAYLITAAVVIIISLLGVSLLSASHTGSMLASLDDSDEPFTAEEIYKMFICSCCGSTIDARCCGMATGMVNYVDSLVDDGLSKTDVIIEMVKKYGMDTLIPSMQDEITEAILRNAPAIRPEISVEPEVYDFGDVSQADGIASTIVTIKNEGDAALVIDGLQTSCGCTTASIGGSPFYGMPGHGGQGASPVGWTYEIPAGGTAELDVRYDPYMHPDFRGTAVRTVYISSNDPVNFREEVRIELNQID
jgi:cytochrome c-type biogenesis protein CcmH/NrfF